MAAAAEGEGELEGEEEGGTSNVDFLCALWCGLMWCGSARFDAHTHACIQPEDDDGESEGEGEGGDSDDGDRGGEEEEEEEEEEEDVELPAYSCRYCGIHDPACVVRCVESDKWFCNSRWNTTGAFWGGWNDGWMDGWLDA